MKNFLWVVFLAFTAFIRCSSSNDGKVDSNTKRHPSAISNNTEAKVQSSKKDDVSVLTSKITCPKCNYTVREQMPTEVCQITYTCKKCKTVLHPQGEDCCVFCTYGDHKCPSKQ